VHFAFFSSALLHASRRFPARRLRALFSASVRLTATGSSLIASLSPHKQTCRVDREAFKGNPETEAFFEEGNFSLHCKFALQTCRVDREAVNLERTENRTGEYQIQES